MYQEKLDSIIESLTSKPQLLIHACCAPCSTSVIEYLIMHFEITIYYYNPNTYPISEYQRRLGELISYIKEKKYDIKIIEGSYDTDKFYEITKTYENEVEGSKRCFNCYKLRLRETAICAKKNNYDYFTTTLSISPYKNSKWINEIGEILESDIGIKYLYGDFKKKDGYKKSIEISKKYNLYRQDYCGCIYSKKSNEIKNDNLFKDIINN